MLEIRLLGTFDIGWEKTAQRRFAPGAIIVRLSYFERRYGASP